MKFDTAEKRFRDDLIQKLAESDDGLRYLKLRSLSRKAHLECLFNDVEIEPTSSKVREQLKEAYNNRECIDNDAINRTIKAIYQSERAERQSDEAELIDQLYRMGEFDWGGLHQNSLEKAIIDRYVKKLKDYDRLCFKIENELHESLRGYTLCSWYNHWTSIIIEDIFKDHQSVLPAVGQIKKVDFFLNDVPFDLKVTYFPEGYVKDKRKEADQRPELTLLKQWAKHNEVKYSKDLSESYLLQDLWAKARDHPSPEAGRLLLSLNEFRQHLISESRENPVDLIQWLYENQGVRRFDASNRLFLVLINNSDFFESWKLKRMKPFLKSEINQYLDNAPKSPGRNLKFSWEGQNYKVKSDAIIIVKDR